MTRVAVTGANGYIGGYLCRALEDRAVEILRVDVLANLVGLEVDILYHLAAPSNVGVFDEDPASAFRQLALANAWLHYIKAETCVFTSTACNEGLYALSKRQTEDLIKELYPDSHKILRLHNVAGGTWPEGREPTHLLPTLQTGKITINGSGQQVRDYVHIDDVIDALMLAGGFEVSRQRVSSTVASRIFTVGTGNGYSVWEVVTRYLQLTGKSVEISSVEGGRKTNPDRQVSTWAFFEAMKGLDEIIKSLR